MKTLFTFLLSGFAALTFAQENCQNAQVVSTGTTNVPQITGEVSSVNCFNDTGNMSAANWYSFTPSETGNFQLTTDLPQNNLRDTRVSVYNGSCEALNCYAMDDDSGTGYTSILTFQAFAGTTYYIAFDNRWTSLGFDFELSSIELPDYPVTFNPLAIGSGNAESLAVDMNGDYLDDIVIPVGNSTVKILYQQNDGSFLEENINTQQFYTSDWSITAGDINGDFKNDILMGNYSGASMVLSNGDNGYTVESSPMFIFTQRTNMVDINNDGKLDAFICHDIEPNVYALNQGNGDFNWIQGGLGDYPTGGNYGSVWVDYDNDGDQDLFIAKCRGGSDAKINELHRNNGDGTFTNVASQVNMADAVQTWSSAWADYDHDGDFDAYIGASSFADGIHRMMINNGSGTFTDQIAGTGIENFTGTGVENTTFDFDNDGWDDILMEAASGTIFFNNGDMTFEKMPLTFGAGAVADLNNDGFLDIYRAGTVFYNNGNENNWLKVVTVGDESNANGIGARVEVSSALGNQMKEVRSGVGFAHGHTLNTHFGLGTDTEIEVVTVKWPSGIVDTYYNVPVNSTLFALEGESLGVQEVAQTAKLTVYPNPVQEILHLNTDKTLTQKAYVFDAAGKMMEFRIENNSINVQKLNAGIYFLKVYDTEGAGYVSRFIVK